MRQNRRPFVCLLTLVILTWLIPAVVRAGEATVHRDTWGVPHIWADDYGSAGYAIGQAQCEDSLQNVVYCLYAGVGRLSELFGPGMIKADLEARTLRHGFYARRDWPKLRRPMRELIEGYCAGVNHYLKTHPNETPVPVQPVTPVQVVAWHRSLLMLSAVGISKADAEASKVDGYHPIYNPKNVGPKDKSAPDDQTGRHPGIAPGKSNSWVLSGRKTASGAPMLLIDPHWMAEGHLQLYELWLHVKDKMEVGGFALTGTPIPGLGVTPYAAWTVTAGGADSSDAYALKIHPKNPHKYKLDDKWLEMDVRQETILARQPDGTMKEKQFKCLATRHGPILKTESGVPYAAAMGGWDRADAFDQYYLMATARTTKSFKQAIALNRLSYFNFMWATTEGQIGFVQTGQAPLRPTGFNWQKMVPGWTSASLYRGRLKLADHPTVENPRTGFLQNCNVAANVVTTGQTMKKRDFPPGVLYGHYGQYRARGARATQLLAKINKATLEDGRRIAFDTYAMPADLWVPIIFQAWTEYQASVTAKTRKSPEHKQLIKAIAMLVSWNRFVDKKSVGATVFRFWRLACDEMKSKVGRDSFAIVNTTATRREAISALKKAVAQLQKRYGRLDVPWGEIKRLRRGKKEWPLSGDALGKRGLDTLRATAADTFNAQNKLIPRGGQCVTSIVVLTTPPTIRSVVAYGQSNKPGSKHFSDQAPLFSGERFRAVPWTLEQLKPNIKSTRKFQYKSKVGSP